MTLFILLLGAGPINTVEDLANALKAGTIKPKQIPIDYFNTNDGRLMMNTRTTTALDAAGIPRSQWYGRDQTGRATKDGFEYYRMLTDQIENNGIQSR